MQRDPYRRRLLPLVDTSFHDRAACDGEDLGLFFEPPDGREVPYEREVREAFAKQVCRRCAVAGECLEDAIARNEGYGIRGGMTADERARERRRRMRRDRGVAA